MEAGFRSSGPTVPIWGQNEGVEYRQMDGCENFPLVPHRFLQAVLQKATREREGGAASPGDRPRLEGGRNGGGLGYLLSRTRMSWATA